MSLVILWGDPGALGSRGWGARVRDLQKCTQARTDAHTHTHMHTHTYIHHTSSQARIQLTHTQIRQVFGIQPVAFGREFALAATVYLPASFLLMNYARRGALAPPPHAAGRLVGPPNPHLAGHSRGERPHPPLPSLFFGRTDPRAEIPVCPPASHPPCPCKTAGACPTCAATGWRASATTCCALPT